MGSKDNLVLWIVSELYYPEDTSTGYYLTIIAEALAKKNDVRVICLRPNYSKKGLAVSRAEIRNGVSIQRVWSLSLNKNNFFLRAINVLSSAVCIFTYAMLNIKAGQRILVGTNPPILGVIMALVARFKGCSYDLKVEDVFPENLVAAGMIKSNHIFFLFGAAVQKYAYTHARNVFVLGRDMEKLLTKTVAPHRIACKYVPNWADVGGVQLIPRHENPLLKKLGVQEKLVVGFFGNIGPLQDVRHFLSCVCALKSESRVHFLVIGSGRLKSWLQEQVIVHGLDNISILEPRPRSEQSVFLGACDLGIVSLSQGMAGLGVPSRTYNLMAAGRPILASVDEGSEIACLVQEERIGWVCKPGDVEGFTRVVYRALDHPTEISEAGTRSRHVAVTKYSAELIVEQYVRLVSSASP